MDAANVHEEGRVPPAGLPTLHAPAAVPPFPVRERPRWLIPAAVYAFSAALALTTAVLFLLGPLGGLGPIRVVIPQAAMFGVICVLWVVADLVPVALPFRGDTYAFVLEEVPLLIGLVFLSPDLLVLSTVSAVAITFAVLRRQAMLKLAFNVASTALGDCARRRRLPRAPGAPQPGQPRGLGRGGGRAGDQPGHDDARHCGSSLMLNGQNAEAADGHHPVGDPGDAHGRRVSASPLRSSMPPGTTPGRRCPSSWSPP